MDSHVDEIGNYIIEDEGRRDLGVPPEPTEVHYNYDMKRHGGQDKDG